MPLLETFIKLRASTQLGGVTYWELNQAMLAMPNKAWVRRLSTVLEAPINAPKTDQDHHLIDAYRDQLFWQSTAAELLGRLGDERAVAPLLEVLLDPAKEGVHATALLALVKLGKPAAEAATKLLAGKDTRVVAALVLGTSGRLDAAPALITAVESETDAALRAILARELSKVPASQASKAAFKRAYESLDLATELPPGVSALEALNDAAGRFHDSGMVDWLLVRAAGTKGRGDELKAYQAGVVMTALKLARPAQLPAVKKALDRYGATSEKDAYKHVAALLKNCAARVDCYIAEIQKSENQQRDKQLTGIKAGYMIGMLGGAQARDQLLEVLDGISNAAVRFVAHEVYSRTLPVHCSQ